MNTRCYCCLGCRVHEELTSRVLSEVGTAWTQWEHYLDGHVQSGVPFIGQHDLDDTLVLRALSAPGEHGDPGHRWFQQGVARVTRAAWEGALERLHADHERRERPTVLPKPVTP